MPASEEESVAEQLEEGEAEPRPGEAWSFENVNRDDTHGIFLHGFNSRATDVDRWISRFARESALGIEGFSYLFPGQRYDKSDTWDGIAHYVRFYESYAAVGRGRTVPLAFSHGANIALRGTAQLIDQVGVAGARSAVRAVILIAPVHQVDRMLFDEYQARSKFSIAPAAVDELSTKSVSDELWASYAKLAHANIPVFVIYSSLCKFQAKSTINLHKKLHYLASRLLQTLTKF